MLAALAAIHIALTPPVQPAISIPPWDIYVTRPPIEYQHAATDVKITFTSDDTNVVCRRGGSASKGRIAACYNILTNVITMPNPCDWPEPYAQILCHEMAHANGWRHDVE